MALTKSLSFSLGRKRVLICDNLEHFCDDFSMKKKKKSFVQGINYEKDFKKDCSISLIEALPQELLLKVVCGVDHDDLKQLFFVSKTIRDVVIIAKKCHFAYSTPSKTKAFRNSIDLRENIENANDFEAPNAPKQARKMKRRRLDWKKLGDIAVELFADEVVADEMQRWPRRSLFMDIDS